MDNEASHWLPHTLVPETTATALQRALRTRDPYTASHNSQTEEVAFALGSRAGMDAHQLAGLRLGARLHDIGKIGIPGDLLAKPGRLSDVEMAFIRQHPTIGHEIVKDIVSPWPIQQMVRSHHERMDGSGYPDGLTGNAICLEARIISIADMVDSMTSYRAYRPALSLATVADEIRSARCRKLDPRLVDICLDLMAEPGFATH